MARRRNKTGQATACARWSLPMTSSCELSIGACAFRRKQDATNGPAANSSLRQARPPVARVSNRHRVRLGSTSGSVACMTRNEPEDSQDVLSGLPLDRAVVTGIGSCHRNVAPLTVNLSVAA